MSVVVSIEDLGGSQKQVKVSVPAPAVEAETDRVAAEYGKQARIPGFRKGKVPASLVKQRFGEEIEKEVVERLLPRYWKQAEAESELEPLLPPEVDSVDFAFGKDLTFVATIDLRPEFELQALDDLTFPEGPGEPGDEDVDEAIEELRRSVSEWNTVERPAARGDRVTVEIGPVPSADDSSGDDAEQESQPELQSSTFEVGEQHVWEELSLAVTGLRTDQQGDFEREFLEGADVEKRQFQFVVKLVEERDLPPLDDAFAKKLGKFDDLAALRANVLENLGLARVNERDRNRRAALIDQLCERHVFELPKRVVREEVQDLLTDYATNLSRQGVDVEKAGIDWQKMGEDLGPQAEKRVRARLVLDRVAKDLEVEVGEEELEQALADMARSRGHSSGALRQQLDREGRLGELREQLLRDKTMRTLLGETAPGDKI